MNLLAPFDYPRQSAYNLARGMGKIGSGEADMGTLASMAPGAAGALLTALLGPGAGVLGAGALQGLGQMVAPDTFEAPTAADLVGSLGGDPESLLQTLPAHIATDPLSYLGVGAGYKAAQGMGQASELADTRAALQQYLGKADDVPGALSAELGVWRKPSNVPVGDMLSGDIDDYLGRAYEQYAKLDEPLVELRLPGERYRPGRLRDRLAGARDIVEKERAALTSPAEEAGVVIDAETGEVVFSPDVNIPSWPHRSSMTPEQAGLLKSMLDENELLKAIDFERRAFQGHGARNLYPDYAHEMALRQISRSQVNYGAPEILQAIEGDTLKGNLANRLSELPSVHPAHLPGMVGDLESLGYPANFESLLAAWKRRVFGRIDLEMGVNNPEFLRYFPRGPERQGVLDGLIANYEAVPFGTQAPFPAMAPVRQYAKSRVNELLQELGMWEPSPALLARNARRSPWLPDEPSPQMAQYAHLFS